MYNTRKTRHLTPLSLFYQGMGLYVDFQITGVHAWGNLQHNCIEIAPCEICEICETYKVRVGITPGLN